MVRNYDPFDHQRYFSLFPPFFFFTHFTFFYFTGALGFVTPILIPRLLSFLLAVRFSPEEINAITTSGQPLPPIVSDMATAQPWHGYVYVAAIFVATLIGSFCNYHAQLMSNALGIKVRSAFTMLMYKKSLYVRPSKNTSTGQITYAIHFSPKPSPSPFQYLLLL